MGRNRAKSGSSKSINRKTKIHLVFDPAARKAFLTGFHSRKMQRKKKAQEEFEKQLKEEKKRLKLEAKKAYCDMVSSHQPIVEQNELNSEVMNLESHCISICELSTAEISTKNNWIGENQVDYDNEKGSNLEKPDDSSSKPEVPLKNEKDIKKILKKKATLNAKNSKPLQKQMQQQRRKNKKESMRKNRLKSKVMKNKKK
ncbi:nucleolar protein 12 isoform X2 [Hetaerina americana]